MASWETDLSTPQRLQAVCLSWLNRVFFITNDAGSQMAGIEKPDRAFWCERGGHLPLSPPHLVHVPSPTRNSSASLTLVGDEPKISQLDGFYWQRDRENIRVST